MSRRRAARAGDGAPLQLRCGKVVDVRNGRASAGASVLIEGGKIVSVSRGAPAPRRARVLDLRNLTVLPGLIDCHTHLLLKFRPRLPVSANLLAHIALGPAKRALQGAAAAREALAAGITAARDLGNSGVNGDVALRDAIDAGWTDGPRLQASTRALAPVGGQFPRTARASRAAIGEEYVELTGVNSARAAVRRAVYDGADGVKVIVSNGSQALSQAELAAAVEEARRLGKKTAAHATSERDAELAVGARVDSLEHGYELSDELLDRMAGNGVTLVPTDWPWDLTRAFLRGEGAPPGTLRDVRRRHLSIRDRFRRAARAGVRIVFGSDMYHDIPGLTRGQCCVATLREYGLCGMPPMEVVRSATLHAAELLGWGDRLGAVEPGKAADLVGVASDPARDPRWAEKVVFVMKAGRVFRGPAEAA